MNSAETATSIASRVYGFASRLEVQWRQVEHDLFGEFCRATRVLLLQLGDTANDELWRDFLAPLRRCRYFLGALPTWFNDPSFLHLFDPNAIEATARLLPSLYPSYSAAMVRTTDLLSELVQSSDAPLLEAVWEVTGPDSALVLASRRLLRLLSVSSAMDQLPEGIDLITPSELKDRIYAQLVLVGPSEWFPEWVVSAPRAPRIDVVKFRWVRDRRSVKGSFVGGIRVPVHFDGEQANEDTLETIEAADLSLVVDWDDIHRLSGVQGADSEADSLMVAGRLVLLEGGWACYVPEGSARLAVNADGTGRPELQRVPAADLQVGTFLLLRTEGGGDLVKPVADRLLGAEAPMLRDSLRAWKRKLQFLVSSEGCTQVVSSLRRLGSPRASEANVRNWMSSQHIRPQDYKDFLALMRLIGMEAEAHDYWGKAQLVVKAHRMAGFRIRRMLLAQVSSANVEALKEHGVMQFNLSQGQGGSIAAFRIEGISPRLYEVPEHRLDTPFKANEEQISLTKLFESLGGCPERPA